MNHSVNIPTVITISRILIIPIFILITTANPFVGAVVFAIASATDLLDGYLARKQKKITKLGILLDPIADKLLVISALIMLVDMAIVPAWIAIIIILREFLVTGLRIVALSRNMVIPAESGGKVKTVAQVISILVLLIDRTSFNMDLYGIGIGILIIAMIIGIFSGIRYFIVFWRRL
ncbi:MAG: CDP-diacylglycerol--glycerol-3-phosphate 3-phosphatidyltransferase [Thermodesulfovibrionia bacterium]